MQLDLRQSGEFSDDLFAVNQPAESSRVMAVLDEINGRWGRGTLRAEQTGLGHASGNDEPELHHEA